MQERQHWDHRELDRRELDFLLGRFTPCFEKSLLDTIVTGNESHDAACDQNSDERSDEDAKDEPLYSNNLSSVSSYSYDGRFVHSFWD